uniref:Uncharacterized protein LOC114328190 n=1 Tax=Diabrotica virgifera virgifera TaxID=50390 RepID=A0A6P7FI69_DIAVI
MNNIVSQCSQEVNSILLTAEHSKHPPNRKNSRKNTSLEFKTKIITPIPFTAELTSTDEIQIINGHSGLHAQGTSTVETSTCTEDTGSPLDTAAKKKQYPKEKNIGRKRQRDPTVWKMNVLKKLRNSGQEYTGKTGKLSKIRELGPGCNDKCIRKCKTKLSENDRVILFNNF